MAFHILLCFGLESDETCACNHSKVYWLVVEIPQESSFRCQSRWMSLYASIPINLGAMMSLTFATAWGQLMLRVFHWILPKFHGILKLFTETCTITFPIWTLWIHNVIIIHFFQFIIINHELCPYHFPMDWLFNTVITYRLQHTFAQQSLLTISQLERFIDALRIMTSWSQKRKQ